LIKVKDVNIKTKHVKPRAEGESGQILKLEAPIHHSQVQPVTKDGAPSRIAKKCVRSFRSRCPSCLSRLAHATRADVAYALSLSPLAPLQGG
jgi:ribosomal protein L24